MDICCPGVWLLFLAFLTYSRLADSKLCDYSTITYDDVSTSCSKFTIMMLDSYFLNKTASGFDSYSDSEIQSIITDALIQPENSPNCIFTKKIETKYEDCCAGWTGTNCSVVVCDPPCKYGYCAMPSFCVCDDGFTGYRCEDLVSQATNVTYQYCYESSQCYGAKQTTFENKAVDESTCCSNGGGGWGVDGTSMCQACSEHHNLDTSVINQTNVLPFRTCLNFGKTYYRTFDGLEYQFSGECTYTLAENHNQGWHVEVSVKQCQTINTCEKKIFIYIDQGDRIEIQSGKCFINGILTELLPGEPHFTPKMSFSIDYSGEWLHIESPNGLRVKVDMKSTVYVTLNKDKNIGEPIHGLCGNSNGDPNDDLETKTQEMTTSPVVFGNSYKIVDSSYICSDAGSLRDACMNVPDSEKNEAAAECSYIRSQTFHECHGLVNEGLWYDICINAHCAEETTEAKRAVICDVTEAYARLCADKNVTIYWRSLLDCPKDCPAGFEYYDSIPRCPRTCKTLHEVMPSECYLETASGCDCPAGKFLQNGVCVLPEECMCDFRGVKYNNSAKIQIGCNRCVCYMGRWNCTMDKCSSTCNVYGLSHVKTFDGLKYEFEATRCSYYLVQPIEPNPNDPASDLSIRILHDHCGEDITNDRNCISGVRIQNQGNVVIINKDSVTINSRDYTEFIHKMPYWTRTLYLKQATSLFILVKGLGYRVLVGFRRVYVSLDPFFDNKVQGICGRFNYNYWDEWTTTTGIKETKAGAFVKSYMHDPGSCAAQTERIAGIECQTNLNEYAREVCAPIQNDEIWMPCRNLIEFYKFYQQCMSDICLIARLNVTEVACVIMAQVARECALQGAIINNWKDHPSIKEMCSSILPCDNTAGGMEYEECAPACSGHCRDVELLDTACEHECIPGCRCPQNQMLSDHGHCVNEDECTCYDKYASLGQSSIEAGSEIERNCERCVCTNAKLNCTEIPDCISNVTCPSNQVFFEDHVLCPSSCESYPQVCDQDQAFTGCSCPEHLTMSPSGTCIEPDTCPCQYNNEWFEPGHEFNLGCKSYRCEHRRWVVTKVETCPGTCWTSGSSNYMTFDGNHYIFEGTCKYTLVKSKNDEFHVTVENAPCGTTGITCYKVVEILLNNIHIQLMRGIAPKVNNYPIPSDEYNDHGIHITKAGLWTFVNIEELSLTIQYDEGTRVFIHLADTWKGLTSGLCGDYNDDQPDDYLGMPDIEFGNSYKTDTTCPDVAPKSTVEMQPCYGTPERLQWTHESCSIIREGETFADCRNAMSDTLLDQYHLDCLYDACRCDKGGDCECLCTALANFAEGCNKINVPVRWRTRWLCPMQCENNMVYSACVAPCPQTCQNIGDEPDVTCTSSSCVEGCTCPPGYVQSGDSCVTAEECPCFHNGVEYPIGTSLNMNGCENCVCMSGKFNCSESVCNKTCDSEQFMCSDGACISVEFLCDGITDCTDNSDETKCAFNCTSDQFKCNSGKCVPNTVLCDGANNCILGEDELFCETTCEEDEFRCETGICIPLSWRCDDSKDCGPFDLSDETNCTEACNSIDQFRCNNGNCVPGTLKCDQHDDCGDGSDEINCELTATTKKTTVVGITTPTTYFPISTLAFTPASTGITSSTSSLTSKATSTIQSSESSEFLTGQTEMISTVKGPESTTESTGRSQSLTIPLVSTSVSESEKKTQPSNVGSTETTVLKTVKASSNQMTFASSTGTGLSFPSSLSQTVQSGSPIPVFQSSASPKVTSPALTTTISISGTGQAGESEIGQVGATTEAIAAKVSNTGSEKEITALKTVTHVSGMGKGISTSTSVSETGLSGSSETKFIGVTQRTPLTTKQMITNTVPSEVTSKTEQSGSMIPESVTESNIFSENPSKTPFYVSKEHGTSAKRVSSAQTSEMHFATSKKVTHASSIGKGQSVSNSVSETGQSTKFSYASPFQTIPISSSTLLSEKTSKTGQSGKTFPSSVTLTSVVSAGQSITSPYSTYKEHEASTLHLTNAQTSVENIISSEEYTKGLSTNTGFSALTSLSGTGYSAPIVGSSTGITGSLTSSPKPTSMLPSISTLISETGHAGTTVEAISQETTIAPVSKPSSKSGSTIQSTSPQFVSGTASIAQSLTMPFSEEEHTITPFATVIPGSSTSTQSPSQTLFESGSSSLHGMSTSVNTNFQPTVTVNSTPLSKNITNETTSVTGSFSSNSESESGQSGLPVIISTGFTPSVTNTIPENTGSVPSLITKLSETGQTSTTLEVSSPRSGSTSAGQHVTGSKSISTVQRSSKPNISVFPNTRPSEITPSSMMELKSTAFTTSIPGSVVTTKLQSGSSLQHLTSTSYASNVQTIASEIAKTAEKVVHASSTSFGPSASTTESETGQPSSPIGTLKEATQETPFTTKPKVTGTIPSVVTTKTEQSGTLITVNVTGSSIVSESQSITPFYASKEHRTSVSHVTSPPSSEKHIATSGNVSSIGTSQSVSTSVAETGQSMSSKALTTGVTQATPFKTTPIATSTALPLMTSKMGQAGKTSPANVTVSSVFLGQSKTSPYFTYTEHETSTLHVTNAPTSVKNTETLEEHTPGLRISTGPSSQTSMSETGYSASSIGTSTGVTGSITPSANQIVSSIVPSVSTSNLKTERASTTVKASSQGSGIAPVNESLTSPKSSSTVHSPSPQYVTRVASTGPRITMPFSEKEQTSFTGQSGSPGVISTEVTPLKTNMKPEVTSIVPSITTELSETGQTSARHEVSSQGSERTSASKSVTFSKSISTVQKSSMPSIPNTGPSEIMPSSEIKLKSTPFRASIPGSAVTTKSQFSSTLKHQTSTHHVTNVITTAPEITGAASEKEEHASSTGFGPSATTLVSETGQPSSFVGTSTGTTYETPLTTIPVVTSVIPSEVTSKTEQSGTAVTNNITESSIIPESQSVTPIYASTEHGTSVTHVTSAPSSEKHIATSEKVTHASSIGKGQSVSSSVAETIQPRSSVAITTGVTQATPFSTMPVSTSSAPPVMTSKTGQSGKTIPASVSVSSFVSEGQSKTFPYFTYKEHEISTLNETNAPTIVKSIATSEVSTQGLSISSGVSSQAPISETEYSVSSVSKSTRIKGAITSSAEQKVTSKVPSVSTSTPEKEHAGSTVEATSQVSSIAPVNESLTSPKSSSTVHIPSPQYVTRVASTGPHITMPFSEKEQTSFTGQSGSPGVISTEVTPLKTKMKPEVTSIVPSITTELSETGQTSARHEVSSQGSERTSASKSVTFSKSISTVQKSSMPSIPNTGPSEIMPSSKTELKSTPFRASIPGSAVTTKSQSSSTLKHQTSTHHVTNVITAAPEITGAASEKEEHASSTGFGPSATTLVSETGQPSSFVGTSTGTTSETPLTTIPVVTSVIPSEVTSKTEQSGTAVTGYITESSIILESQSVTPFYASTEHGTSVTHVTSAPSSEKHIATSEKVTHASSIGKGQSVSSSVAETIQSRSSVAITTGVTQATPFSTMPVSTSSAPPVMTSKTGQSGKTIPASVSVSSFVSEGQSKTFPYFTYKEHEISTLNETNAPTSLKSIGTSEESTQGLSISSGVSSQAPISETEYSVSSVSKSTRIKGAITSSAVQKVTSKVPSVSTSTPEKEHAGSTVEATSQVSSIAPVNESLTSPKSSSTVHSPSPQYVTRVASTGPRITMPFSEKKQTSFTGQSGSPRKISTGVTPTTNTIPQITSIVPSVTAELSETGQTSARHEVSSQGSESTSASKSVISSKSFSTLQKSSMQSIPMTGPSEITPSSRIEQKNTPFTASIPGPAVTTKVQSSSTLKHEISTSPVTYVETTSSEITKAESEKVTHASSSGFGPSASIPVSETGQPSLPVGTPTLANQTIPLSSKPVATMTIPSEVTSKTEQSGITITVNVTGPRIVTERQSQTPPFASEEHGSPVSNVTRVPSSEKLFGSSEKVTHSSSIGKGQSIATLVTETGQSGSSEALSTGATQTTPFKATPISTSSAPPVMTSKTGQLGKTFPASIPVTRNVSAGQSKTSYLTYPKHEISTLHVTNAPTSVKNIVASEEFTQGLSISTGLSAQTAVSETEYSLSSVGTSTGGTGAFTPSAKQTVTSKVPSLSTSIPETEHVGTTMEASSQGSSFAHVNESLTSPKSGSTVYNTSSQYATRVPSTKFETSGASSVKGAHVTTYLIQETPSTVPSVPYSTSEIEHTAFDLIGHGR